MGKSQIFLYFCLSFIGGIFLNSMIVISQLFILGFLILGILLITVFGKYKKITVAGFCFLFLTAGIWRYQIVESQIPDITEQNIAFTGIVSEESDIREKHIKLTIKTEAVPGKILVSAGRYPEYQYGDKLKISGRLEKPPVFDKGEEDKSSSSPFAIAREFNYRDYLKKDGIFAVMVFPAIELVGQNFGSPIYEFLFSFKDKFKEAVQKFISPPQRGILEALVFGDEGGISKAWKEKLNITGTRHIAAVSGMNITIISSLIFNFLLWLGLWRQQAFYLSLVLLVLYILMIGAPASAVRAGIMGILFLTAQHFGRMSAAASAVVFAAALILALNPLLLRLDVGFQLSFLAIMGIIYLQPAFSSFFKKLANPKFFPLRTTLATTLSAQVFTLPILVYNFGYISLLSPITNILIVPVLAPITILIFVFGLSAMILGPLGYILSWPTWLSLTYIISIIDGFSKLSFVSLILENIHWAWLIIAYLTLGCLTWQLNKKEKIW